jgi:hypothetical protein
MCEQVIACGKDGKTLAEMAVEIGVDRDTVKEWRKEKPEFSAAIKRGLEHAQAWWERKGRFATFESSGFNATSYIFQMKNRFKEDWRDRVETDHTSSDGSMSANKTLTEEQLLEELERRGLSDKLLEE